jgi:hypothetical protein
MMRRGKMPSNRRFISVALVTIICALAWGCVAPGSIDTSSPDSSASLYPDPTATGFVKPPGSVIDVPVPDPSCFVMDVSADQIIPRTIHNMAAMSSAVVVGTFQGYGAARWNTPSGMRPSAADFQATPARLVRPLTIGVQSSVRALKTGAIHAVVRGGSLGCDQISYSDTPSLTQGSRYVFFLVPIADSTMKISSDILVLEAWPGGGWGLGRDPFRGIAAARSTNKVDLGDPIHGADPVSLVRGTPSDHRGAQGMARIARGMSLLVTSVLIAACTTSNPTPTAIGSDATAVPLSVVGSGKVACDSLSACRAALSILPVGQSPTQSPDDRFYEFEIQPSSTDGMGTWNLAGPLVAGPTSVNPGTYTLVAQIEDVSDVPSPGFSLRPILAHLGSCTADLIVRPSTARVSIHVSFDGEICQIAVS